MSSCRNKSADPVLCDRARMMMRTEKKSDSLNSHKRTPMKPTAAKKSAASRSPVKQTLDYEDSRGDIKLRKPKKSTETWGTLLKTNKGTDYDSLSSFDPLRSVHFITKELKSRLHSVVPDDYCTQDMLGKLETALNRVPPEVASAIQLYQVTELLPKRKHHLNEDDLKPVKLSSKESKLHQSENQKIMRINTERVETKLMEMEEQIIKLRIENQQSTNQLAVERDNVAYYKARLQEFEKSHAESVTGKITQMEEHKCALESQIGDLKVQVAMLNKPRDDVKKCVQQLKLAKAEADNEIIKLRHQLKLCEIEKEKYMAVLAVRDRQIGEIRNEMSQLQEVVNEQLMDLHTNAFSNMPSNVGSESDLLHDNKETDGVFSFLMTDYKPAADDNTISECSERSG